MTQGRTFTDFAKKTPKAMALLDELLEHKGDVAHYRENMRMLGEHLATSLLPLLHMEKNKNICVICTVEDADYLASGLIKILENNFKKIRLLCMWNERIEQHGVSISPIRKSYIEDYSKENAIFIVVKSIISGSCVVKTNLTRAITDTNPKKVFVVAPVMHKNAKDNLEKEFPKKISELFEYINFATDSEKSEDGSDVIPGIGGSVYELYGFENEAAKNKYIPELVRYRRKKEFPITAG